MNARSILSALLVLTLSSSALADPPKPPAPLTPIPPGEDRIESVQQGVATPFAGQLFDNKTAMRWGNYLEQCRVRLAADVEYQWRIDQAQIDFLKTSLAAREDQLKFVTTEYQKQLQEARDPAFYKTTWFGVVVGVVGTVAAVSATAYLVHASK